MGVDHDVNFNEMAETPVYQTESKTYVDSEWEECTARQAGFVMMVKTVSGDVKVNPSDWLVKYPSGMGLVNCVKSDEVFHKEFSLVEKEDNKEE